MVWNVYRELIAPEVVSPPLSALLVGVVVLVLIVALDRFF